METFDYVFKPAAVATKNLQVEQCTMGDFFKTWIECEIWLNIDNNFAAELLVAMSVRKKKLFKNEVFVSALFLDPRFN